MEIQNGRFSFSTSFQEYLPGTVVTYQCDNGYYIHTPDEDFNFQTARREEYSIRCERNGEWNIEVPHCKGTTYRNKG